MKKFVSNNHNIIMVKKFVSLHWMYLMPGNTILVVKRS